ncbi:MAG: hypothetical protein A2W91_12870 [Bacteroidetes bacterium GWF2_38_335]|nr:MAG: hypothetical protein A2W91_12870 [Bacteroidetes bacterium GWF2_38_335]HBS86918.1 hypothetical protein [Bacteroidales bacterium]
MDTHNDTESKGTERFKDSLVDLIVQLFSSFSELLKKLQRISIGITNLSLALIGFYLATLMQMNPGYVSANKTWAIVGIILVVVSFVIGAIIRMEYEFFRLIKPLEKLKKPISELTKPITDNDKEEDNVPEKYKEAFDKLEGFDPKKTDTLIRFFFAQVVMFLVSLVYVFSFVIIYIFSQP